MRSLRVNNGGFHEEQGSQRKGNRDIRAVDDDRQFYFHRDSVLHDDFDRLGVGIEVRFAAEQEEGRPAE